MPGFPCGCDPRGCTQRYPDQIADWNVGVGGTITRPGNNQLLIDGEVSPNSFLANLDSYEITFEIHDGDVTFTIEGIDIFIDTDNHEITVDGKLIPYADPTFSRQASIVIRVIPGYIIVSAYWNGSAFLPFGGYLTAVRTAPSTANSFVTVWDNAKVFFFTIRDTEHEYSEYETIKECPSRQNFYCSYYLYSNMVNGTSGFYEPNVTIDGIPSGYTVGSCVNNAIEEGVYNGACLSSAEALTDIFGGCTDIFSATSFQETFSAAILYDVKQDAPSFAEPYPLPYFDLVLRVIHTINCGGGTGWASDVNVGLELPINDVLLGFNLSGSGVGTPGSNGGFGGPSCDDPDRQPDITNATWDFSP